VRGARLSPYRAWDAFTRWARIPLCHEYDYAMAMARLWHSDGMSRSRVSTTVDEGLLVEARLANPGKNDAVLFDAALAALLARTRAFAIDDSYTAYDEHPIDEPDEWGDLGSFRSAAAAS
jgi:hypothetical protein